MLTCILIKPGVMEIKDVPNPKPSKGEILLKIVASLTCGTDLKAFQRGHSLIPMPGVFGHEFSGIIVKAGRAVKRFKEGDEVMAVHTAPCLKCRLCKKGLYNLCEHIMYTKVLGAFAEYILLPSHIVRQNVFQKPPHLDSKEAAMLEPLACAVHSIEPLDIKRGDSVLIIGAGAMGLLHLILLKSKKAKVAVTEIRKERLTIAKRHGADLIIPTPLFNSLFTKGVEEGHGKTLKRESGRVICEKGLQDPKIKKFTDGIGFDYVFECAGRPEVWETSVNYLRRGGTLIFFGGCEKGTKVTYDTYRLHYDEITLRGSFHYTPGDVQKAYELLSGGRLKLSALISGSYPLKHIDKAFNKLAKGEGIKYAIIP